MSMHGPNFSILSKLSVTKDNYSVEDYIQLAQQPQHVPESFLPLLDYLQSLQASSDDEASHSSSEDNDLAASTPQR